MFLLTEEILEHRDYIRYLDIYILLFYKDHIEITPFESEPVKVVDASLAVVPVTPSSF